MTMTLTDAFWSRYHTLIKDEMIPYQWSVLNDEADITIDKERDDDFIPSEKSHALENLRIAAGQSKGHHYGWLFQDSDVYKWLESAANSYALTPDDSLMAMMEEVVNLIVEAGSSLSPIPSGLTTTLGLVSAKVGSTSSMCDWTMYSFPFAKLYV